MIDFSQVKLGRKALKTDSRTLRLANYLTASLPAAPVSCDWTKGVTQWGMMLNDRLGDCTCAAVGHAVQLWTLNLGEEITEPDSEIESAYEEWCGYNPADPATDEGGVELDILTDWKNHSFKGHYLLGFASANPKNLDEIKQAINLFGLVYIGISLPLSAQGQMIWDVVPDDGSGNTEPGSWGGHAVVVVGYDAFGLICITWGGLMRITNAFWLKYVDEVYALLGADWVGSKGAPSGFLLAPLKADIALIR